MSREMKLSIPIILGSTRRGRQSDKVARYLLRLFETYSGVETQLVDLLELRLPIMEERLRFRDDPPPGLREFSALIDRADGILIVSPEYNHGYPGVLKNALDYLLPEYERKPFGICTVSAGGFGGLNCLTQLRGVVMGVGGVPIPESLAVSKVGSAFDADGNPSSASFEGRAREFLDEMVWWADAVRMKKAAMTRK
jgi:NAD(P)H-dependent FMN reductase